MRPFQKLSRVFPGMNNAQVAVMGADMAMQVVNTTIVANTPGGMNIVLNSLLHTNVVAIAIYPRVGQSYSLDWSEVTAPTQSAYVFSATAHSLAAPSAIAGRIILMQLDDS